MLELYTEEVQALILSSFDSASSGAHEQESNIFHLSQGDLTDRAIFRRDPSKSIRHLV